MSNKIKVVVLPALFSACLLAAPFALAKDVVKIAFVGPLTGGTSPIGLGGRNSSDLAVKEHNAKADSPYEYELVSLDDECKPNVGVQIATKIASDKEIIGGITHYCSAVAMSAVDVYHKFSLPVVVWGAVLPDITYANDFKEVHRVNGTMINQNQEAAKFMVDHGYKTFAVIHDTTDYGKGHNQYFSQALEKAGGKIVGTFGVTADQQDFTAELTQIKQLKPQVIYFGGLTPIGIRIRSQMEKLGIDAQLEGTSGIKSDSYIEGVGAPIAEGSLSFIEGAPWEKLAAGPAFFAAYGEQKYAQPAEAYGPFAYVATNLLMDAIDKVGPNRRKVREELNHTKDASTMIGPVTFDDHRQNIVPLITSYVVQDGKWVPWQDSEYASGKRTLKDL
ncbi:branched-chain amino acid ABC transporter substrate-binding protein [Pseudomonas sp. TH39(2020)]|uniref:branched-chain amino acid ABC transporter substrate-binding protein n=1 Tax=Pseudomonas sp. TH39(2020) TaxID=2796349 RepID=UPI00191468D2|nr:branched-chain amino acid ABC transporter substrate-binding protein [Pseudomonas sp. TH39(2020)]MBK5401445.1 branched-chain amino acid ABC transporter substrate-binding protein [Pseudomonas sp. TH39(2020)]